jgi:hypothetical protein
MHFRTPSILPYHEIPPVFGFRRTGTCTAALVHTSSCSDLLSNPLVTDIGSLASPRFWKNCTTFAKLQRLARIRPPADRSILRPRLEARESAAAASVTEPNNTFRRRLGRRRESDPSQAERSGTRWLSHCAQCCYVTIDSKASEFSSLAKPNRVLWRQNGSRAAALRVSETKIAASS